MINVEDLIGRRHEVVACKLDNITTHYDGISSNVPDYDKENFISRMEDCVNNGTAYMIADGSCFIYYDKDTESPAFAAGVALYGAGSPLKMIALFTYVFTHVDSKVLFMRLSPHSPTFVNECKSLLTINSVIDYSISKDYLMIRVDEIRDKVNKLIKSRLVL